MPSWGPLVLLLERSWAPLGPSFFSPLPQVSLVSLGFLSVRRMRCHDGDPQRASGVTVGALGAVLGLSWAPLLGALLGHLGAILKPRMAIGNEKAERQTSFVFFRFGEEFGLLEASLESYLASWSHPRAVLGPLTTSSELF